MRTPFLFSIAAGLAFSVLSATAEPDEKSDIEIKTKSAEITVTTEKELKGDPALTADLLAEGRNFVAKSRAEADEAFKTNRASFNGRRWTYDRVYSFRSLVADRYLGILRDDGTYSGGAHPNSRIDTILWDRAAKKRISIRTLFNETGDNGPTMIALAKSARLAVATEKLARWKEAAPDDEKNNPQPTPEQMAADDQEIQRSIPPKLLAIGPISLAPSTVAGKSSGLTFHYSAYDVDAYAAGPYTVFVSWTAFKPYLSTEGIAVFAGERPEADAQQ